MSRCRRCPTRRPRAMAWRPCAASASTGWTAHDSEQRLAAVLALAEGRDTLAADDSARAVVAAVAAADGVLIAGGGNLASTWPLHVYERAALAGIAARLGRPLVVSGQTLGPDLRGRDRELVAELLRSARLVGVRESSSHLLASDLGVDARLGVDDASFVGWPAEGAVPAADGVLVSLSLSLGRAPRDETVARIAALVDAAADATAGPVRFHAHFGPLTGAEPRGDAVLHEEVRARMRHALDRRADRRRGGCGIPRPLRGAPDHRAISPRGVRRPGRGSGARPRHRRLHRGQAARRPGPLGAGCNRADLGGRCRRHPSPALPAAATANASPPRRAPDCRAIARTSMPGGTPSPTPSGRRSVLAVAGCRKPGKSRRHSDDGCCYAACQVTDRAFGALR